MTQPRHTADHITDDALDRLYDELDTLRAVARSNREHVRAIVPDLEAAVQRAERAEAALNAIRAIATRMEDWDSDIPSTRRWVTELRAALDTHTTPTET